jgi:hypothetical protein
MPPKEKAIELVNKYYNKIEHTISNEYIKVTKEITKECALIAVDEIIDELTNRGILSGFWYEVHLEIKKL